MAGPTKLLKPADFLALSRDAARRAGYTIGNLQADDLTFEGMPCNLRPKQKPSLDMQFLNELARMASNDLSLSMMKTESHLDWIVIFVNSTSFTDFQRRSEAKSLFLELSKALTALYKSRGGQHYESAKEHLWATVLSFRRSRIRREVEKLRLIFIEHKDVFETILEKLLGLCDYQSEDFDPLIGDEIIALHERVVGFDVEDDSALQTMLARASRLNKLSNFAERLARVIGRRDMSAPLVKVITGLARPQDAFEIFVRFTSGLKNVRKIHILLGLPGNGALTPPIPLRSIKNDSTGQLKIMKPKDEQLKVEPPKVERSNIGRTKIEQSNPRTSREVSTTPTTGLNSGICEEAFNSLPFSERGRGVPYMAPPTRQTLLLLNSLLRKKLPGAHEESYLSFGFASCRNNTESMHLGGLYTALLVDCVDKEESFKAVAQALETDTLVRLFEENGYGADSLRVIPGATAFLRTSSKWRPTVWRLIQFLHAEDVTDPPGYLRRDYGFQWCKGREDVQNLKEIYTRILKKCSSPMELHQACTQSRLWELGLSKQVGITVGDKRLMQNLVGHPDLGFEDGEPPKGYENKHFRKRK